MYIQVYHDTGLNERKNEKEIRDSGLRRAGIQYMRGIQYMIAKRWFF